MSLSRTSHTMDELDCKPVMLTCEVKKSELDLCNANAHIKTESDIKIEPLDDQPIGLEMEHSGMLMNVKSLKEEKEMRDSYLFTSHSDVTERDLKIEPLNDQPNGQEAEPSGIIMEIRTLSEEEEVGDSYSDLSHICKKRFSREEEATLWREVLSHWDELFGQRSYLLPRVSRGSIWRQVAAAVQASSGMVREGEEVRRKWYYLKNQLKAKLAVINASGKEEPGSELSELEAEVASRMKETTTGSDGGCDVEGLLQDPDRTFQAYHKRFSKNEEEILYKEILHHWEELFGERRKLLPRGSRSAIWDIIATKMNARSGSPVIRGGEDVRKKWCHLRKQKLHEEPVQEQPGEGGTAEDDLYLLKQRILSRMEQDAAEGKTGTIASSGRRFSKEEEDLLYTEILNHWEALFGERNQLVPASSSSVRVWTQITTKFNAALTAVASWAQPRDLEELRKKWSYLKNQLKAKLAPAWASDGRGGGQQEQRAPQLTPLEERIAIRMKMITAKPGMSVDCAVTPPDDSLRSDESNSESSNMERLPRDLLAPLSPPPSPPLHLPSSAITLTPPTVQMLLSKQEESSRLLNETLRVQTASLEVQKSCLKSLQEVQAALAALLEVQKAQLELERNRKFEELSEQGRASLESRRGGSDSVAPTSANAVQTLKEPVSVIATTATAFPVFGTSCAPTGTLPSPSPGAFSPGLPPPPPPAPAPLSPSSTLPQGASIHFCLPATSSFLGAALQASPLDALPGLVPGGALAAPPPPQKRKRGRPPKTTGRAFPFHHGKKRGMLLKQNIIC